VAYLLLLTNWYADVDIPLTICGNEAARARGKVAAIEGTRFRGMIVAGNICCRLSMS
jgi:hypothetical protein